MTKTTQHFLPIPDFHITKRHTKHLCPNKYLLLLFALGPRWGLFTTRRRSLLLLAAGTVHLVKQIQRRSLDGVGLGLQLLGGDCTVARLGLGNKLPESSDLLLDGVGLGLVQLVLEILQCLLGIVYDRVRAVGGLDSVLAFLISNLVTLGIVDHRLNLGVGEARAGCNGDGLVLVGGLVLGGNMHDGVGVDVKGDLNLGDTAVGRWDTDKLEVSKELVVTDELTLSLVDLDLDGGLEIGSGGEN